VLVTAGLVVGGLLGGQSVGERASAGSGAGQRMGAAPAQQGNPGETLRDFCAASRRVQRAQANYLAGLEQGGGAESERDFVAAQRAFVRDNRGLFDLVERTAPEAIRSDVMEVVTAARRGARASGASSQAAAAALPRVTAFVERNC